MHELAHLAGQIDRDFINGDRTTKREKTDMPTLLSADILALRLQLLSPPIREVTICAS
jgi:hypothetical protein